MKGGPRDVAGGEARTSAIQALPAFFALQDVMLLGYLGLASKLVWDAAPLADAQWCAQRLFICIAVVVLGCFLRGLSGSSPVFRAIGYRLALAGVLLYNYLMLRDLLPLVRPDSVDAALLDLDLRIFGFEPALWLERLNTRPVIEWFSFFYFSYFFICATYLATVVWLSRAGRQTTEFAIGTLIVFCSGQLGYMAVPAFGPIRYLSTSFHGPLAGGFFWGCVWKTVQAGSAMKDVFPSLHTAVPTWFTLFAAHQAKRDPRWRWPACVTGFFAANIVFSTMLLRWHYAIDVVAGLALATTAGLLAPFLAGVEERWRTRHGYAAPWTFR